MEIKSEVKANMLNNKYDGAFIDMARSTRFLIYVGCEDGFEIGAEQVKKVEFLTNDKILITFYETIGEDVESCFLKFRDAKEKRKFFSITVYILDGEGNPSNTKMNYDVMTIYEIMPKPLEYGSDEAWGYSVGFEPFSNENNKVNLRD